MTTCCCRKWITTGLRLSSEGFHVSSFFFFLHSMSACYDLVLYSKAFPLYLYLGYDKLAKSVCLALNSFSDCFPQCQTSCWLLLTKAPSNTLIINALGPAWKTIFMMHIVYTQHSYISYFCLYNEVEGTQPWLHCKDGIKFNPENLFVIMIQWTWWHYCKNRRYIFFLKKEKELLL